MTDTDKNPASFAAPRGIFLCLPSGNVAGVLLHADPEPDADGVIRTDVDPFHQACNDHPPGLRFRIIEGLRQETKSPINAARYLTGAAKDNAIGFNSSSVQNSYNQDSSVTLTGNSFYVRDETDIRSLAIEIATLTKRQQRGRGLRMA